MVILTPEQRFLNKAQRIQKLYHMWIRGMLSAAERNIEISKIIVAERDPETRRRLATVFDYSSDEEWRYSIR